MSRDDAQSNIVCHHTWMTNFRSSWTVWMTISDSPCLTDLIAMFKLTLILVLNEKKCFQSSHIALAWSVLGIAIVNFNTIIVLNIRFLEISCQPVLADRRTYEYLTLQQTENVWDGVVPSRSGFELASLWLCSLLRHWIKGEEPFDRQKPKFVDLRQCTTPVDEPLTWNMCCDVVYKVSNSHRDCG